MTYAQFHLAFTLPVLIALALLHRPPAGAGRRHTYGPLGLIVLLAVVYTTPWDNYLVYRDVWGYSSGRVLGTLGYVPVEEYAFFVIQAVIAGLAYLMARDRFWLPSTARPEPSGWRVGGTLAAVVVAVVGAGLLIAPSDHALYLGLILAWAFPVVALMWWLGHGLIWADRTRIAATIAVASVYLWTIDAVAIRLGIWSIRDRYTLGLDPLGLPVEEAVFFSVTTALCVLGLALLLPLAPAKR